MSCRIFLTDGLKNINHAEKRSNSLVLVGPHPNIIVWFVTVTMKYGYIAEFQINDDHRAGIKHM
jgi:ribosomal protein S8